MQTKQTTLEPGHVMKYIGKGHPGLHGCIVKVLRAIVGDDEKPTGYYEIQPWVEEEGRYSWITSDARAEDLIETPECAAYAYERNVVVVPKVTLH